MPVKIQNIDNCVACGACASACGCDVLAVNDHVEIVNADNCVSCGACADSCGCAVLVVE